MQVETLDATVVDYINEIKTQYEHQIHKKNEIILDLLEYQNKYLEIKERYDLLVYKRFMRSAERLPADTNQPLLFTREEKEAEAVQEGEAHERTEVKSHSRKKPGRKPLDPCLPREEIIIDIPEGEENMRLR